ncbi:MAG: selenocysteine-specific translation elongation factor [Desulfobacteraceae bacterium]|nr:selenocysteine-specific translation elongation factor [Desulfobacteraceae bacterium]
MEQFILGTAGHIDHGKTSLIKAVTGTDTDRLKEEKLRGITIELGFASMTLPSGRHVGVVDVPGHEKFVKNMVAGATGIDMVAMVIAADEGVMPQTREHMEICALLGIQHGVVVVSKIDMVDEEWLELVKDDIAEFTRGTFLENAPMVPVSAVKKKGLDDFIATIDDLSKGIATRKPSGIFRLPVDRVFSMKGFGTVITGTMISGSVSVGDTIMIYPSEITSKVRGIQVHNKSVDTAGAGARTAVNFQGLDKESVRRGEILAKKDALRSSYMTDVYLTYLKSNKKPIKNRTRVRFHTGTSEALGKLILLDRDELAAGDASVVQVRLEAPVALIKDDRFVIRSYSPVRTIGGGQVLDPIPPKHKRFHQDISDGLMGLIDAAAEQVIPYHLNASRYLGVSFNELLLMTNLPEKQLNQLLQGMLSKKEAILVDKDARIYIHGDNFNGLINQLVAYVAAYHERHPLKSGISKEELKSKFSRNRSDKVFTLALNQILKTKEMIQEDETIRLSGHKVALAVDQEELRNKILSIYQDHKLMPPYFKDVIKNLGMAVDQAKGILQLLLEKSLLVKIKDDLYYHPESLNGLKDRLLAFLDENGEISTPQFKDMTGASRKYVIPLLEYFDAVNLTIRIGDIRKLRKRQ